MTTQSTTGSGYVAPSGWVESWTEDHGERRKNVFHETLMCPRIRDHEGLRQVTRPGYASRCRNCSPHDY